MTNIKRLTTPDQNFSFDVDPEAISELLITYKQKTKIVLEKNKGDLTFYPYTENGETKYLGFFTLSQEETRNFNIHDHVLVQARGVAYGRAFASEIWEVDIYDVLNPAILGGEENE